MNKHNVNGLSERLSENIESLINDYLMLSRDFYLYESGGVIGNLPKVKLLNIHNPSKYPLVFKILLKIEIEEYPEELLIELEKLIGELRKIEKEIRKFDLDKKEKLLIIIQKQIINKQNELGFILPERFKEIFLKALQLDKIEIFPSEVIDEANEEITRIMRLPKTPS